MTDSQRWFTFVLILLGLFLVYLLGPVLVPFLLAFLLAYLLNPLVERFQGWRIPRVISALVLFLILLAVLLTFVLSVLPALEEQFVIFIKKIPLIVTWAQTVVLPWAQKFDFPFYLDANTVKAQILQHVNANGSSFAKVVLSTAFSSGYFLFEMIMTLILVPVVTIYILVDWHTVTEKGKLLLPLSAERRDIAVGLIKECGDVLGGFFRGQFLVMLALAAYYSIALGVIGLDFSLLLGVIIGTLSVVPYLGFITGLLIGLVTVLVQYHNWLHIVLLLGVFGIGQVFESMVFSPLFVGDRIGLHPIAVIFAVLAGGRLFGFVGVLLALPAAAVIMVFFRYMQHRYFCVPLKEG